MLFVLNDRAPRACSLEQQQGPTTSPRKETCSHVALCDAFFKVLLYGLLQDYNTRMPRNSGQGRHTARTFASVLSRVFTPPG